MAETPLLRVCLNLLTKDSDMPHSLLRAEQNNAGEGGEQRVTETFGILRCSIQPGKCLTTVSGQVHKGERCRPAGLEEYYLLWNPDKLENKRRVGDAEAGSTSVSVTLCSPPLPALYELLLYHLRYIRPFSFS